MVLAGPGWRPLLPLPLRPSHKRGLKDARRIHYDLIVLSTESRWLENRKTDPTKSRNKAYAKQTTSYCYSPRPRLPSPLCSLLNSTVSTNPLHPPPHLHVFQPPSGFIHISPTNTIVATSSDPSPIVPASGRVSRDGRGAVVLPVAR